jgi:hypothetical protein
VFGRHKSDGGAGETQTLPPFHFVNLFEAESVNQVAYARGDHNGLVGGNLAQAFAVEMVEVGVSDENQVDIGQVVVGQARMAKPTNNK